MEKEKSNEEKVKAIVETYALLKNKTYDAVISEMKVKFPNLEGNAFSVAVLREIAKDEESQQKAESLVNQWNSLVELGKNVEIVPPDVLSKDLAPRLMKLTDDDKKFMEKQKEAYLLRQKEKNSEE